MAIIQLFEVNSKKIIQDLGGKKSMKSFEFKKELEAFKYSSSQYYRMREFMVKVELNQNNDFEHLIRKSNQNILQLYKDLFK